FELARHNMIEQQIRTWEVLDQNVLDRIADLHREDFMPAEYRRLALADINIPIGHGQLSLSPKLEARLLQTLMLTGTEKVLEVGTGCGYLTALLARSAAHVVSVDIHADFSRDTATKLLHSGIENVTLATGDAIHGWPTAAPYDAIAVTGSVPVLTGHWQQQLSIGGRLFVIVGESPVMEAWLIRRVGEAEWARESLFETDLPALIGATTASVFEF
ncbi:MAG: protein-L-isoaspartate O-methyltransferase, partial [Gammaproteobacteria bacterium]